MSRGVSTPQFVERLDRLKCDLGLHTDKEVALVLGMRPSALRARLRRGAFPEIALRSLAKSRPDLLIDPDFVLSGELDTSVVVLGGFHNPGPERQIDLIYALEDLVPAMSSSFDISTKNGCISIASRPLMMALQDLLSSAIEGELALSRASYAAKFTVEAGNEL